MSYTPNLQKAPHFTVLTFSRQRFTLCPPIAAQKNMTTPISNNPDSEGLPLQELNIVPDWLKSSPKSFENHSGEDTERRPRRDRGPRDMNAPRRDRDQRPPRRPEPGGQGRPPRREHDRDRDRGPRPVPQGRPQMEPRSAPPPIVPLEISFLPEEKGFASMLETMKHSPRAYALFDVAKLVLNKPERHVVKLSRKPGADGACAPLFLVVADESVFLSQDDAVRHIFRRQMDKLSKQEKKPCDPPKGNFAFVNRCGITGEIFGPPNHHEYQSLIVRHHQRRLRHMPFEDFRARIETSKDPEVVKQWVESRSFITEYQCIACAEPKICATREELEKHITETHLAQLITNAPELQINGANSRQQPIAGIAEALRIAWVSERKFPLKTAQVISDKLRHAGFHFFKHAKGITYVSNVRMKRFETLDGLSEQVQKIITFLRAHPDSVRKQLAESLQAADADRLIADLHWLIQEGYVVEFSDGRLWTQENRPPKPAEPKAAPTPATESTTVVAEVPAPVETPALLASQPAVENPPASTEPV